MDAVLGVRSERAELRKTEAWAEVGSRDFSAEKSCDQGKCDEPYL